MPIASDPVAFVFDMDGTITDNMAFHTKAWMQTLRDLDLAPVDPDDWERRTSGMPNREIFRDLLGLPLDDDDIRGWVEHKEALYREVAGDQVREIDGFSAFLDRSRSVGVRLGLATGAGPENIEFNLDALGLHHAFDAIVGAANVKKGKPDPEIFLTTASTLGVPADRVVVFEDAPMGIDAARNAGMPVVGVPTMLGHGALADYPGVVRVITDFASLDPEELVATVLWARH